MNITEIDNKLKDNFTDLNKYDIIFDYYIKTEMMTKYGELKITYDTIIRLYRQKCRAYEERIQELEGKVENKK